MRTLLTAFVLFALPLAASANHPRLAVARRLDAMGLTTYSNHVQVGGSQNPSSRHFFVNDVEVRRINMIPSHLKGEPSVDVHGTVDAHGTVTVTDIQALKD